MDIVSGLLPSMYYNACIIQKVGLDMGKKLKIKIWKEIQWLFSILLGAIVVEWSIIYLLNIHSILKIKIQVFTGLVLLGYVIRMFSRIWVSYHSSEDPINNGQEILE